MINYSIIIPHKNIPNLLQRCLDSIPIRDDTQVIVVDDDSNSELVDFSNFPGVDQPNVEIVYLKEGMKLITTPQIKATSKTPAVPNSMPLTFSSKSKNWFKCSIKILEAKDTAS